MSSRRFDRVRAALREWMVQANQHAVVALAARRGVVVLHETLGRLRPEADSPPTTPQTVFAIASASKPITATAVMILVEEGRIGLNLPASFYLPELTGEGKDAITILHLLTHTSGMRDQEVDEYARSVEGTLPATPPEPTQHPELASFLAARWDAPLWKRPGEEMSYGGYNYRLLGEVVRRVTGKSLAEFTTSRIFAPLGMTGTTWCLSGSRAALAALPTDPDLAPSVATKVRVPFPSGSAFATGIDLAAFGQMFLNRGTYGGARILAPTTVAAMTRNQIAGVAAGHGNERFAEACYGLGWQVLDGWKGTRWALTLASARTFCHPGISGALLWVDPEYELVGVYLAAQDASRALSRYASNSTVRHYAGTLKFADAVTAAIADTDGAP